MLNQELIFRKEHKRQLTFADNIADTIDDNIDDNIADTIADNIDENINYCMTN